MTQPSFQPAQPPPYQPAPPPPKPPRRKRFGWLALILATVAALLVGSALGAIGDAAPTTGEPIAAKTATITATKTVQAPGEGEGTEAPDPEPTEEAAAGYQPKKSDWEVTVKITDKQCFGSAGCSIDYKIKPKFVGTQTLPDTGVIEVTFEILGDEDPIIGTFTVEDGRAQFDDEGSMSTPRSSTEVKAKITDVEYDENG